MQKVEGGVEDLVAGAHSEENRPGGVVQVHDGVAGGVHELVARAALKKRSKFGKCILGNDDMAFLTRLFNHYVFDFRGANLEIF